MKKRAAIIYPILNSLNQTVPGNGATSINHKKLPPLLPACVFGVGRVRYFVTC